MILQKLATLAKERVATDKEKVPFEQVKEMALSMPQGDFRFEKALQNEQTSVIAEVKKASPSKGVISADFPYKTIAKEYESAGADCLSVLTEPFYFLGSDEIFSDIRKECALPMLRKDFTVDDYQIYQSKLLGADAVLLICSLHDEATLARRLEICDVLGISALVETHDEKEIALASRVGAKVIGINNRNLKTFDVSLENTLNLAETVPKGALFVAESGIWSVEDAKNMAKAGANAVLIGEALMRSGDRKGFIRGIKAAG